ncbi:MAG: Endonuclease/exonuclease/phosphatase, partial [Candidatus Magasanikbacteria bacterium GW2011_GWA2_43_9]
DSDGDVDLMLHFDTQASGLTDNDVSAILVGTTQNGVPVEGRDFLNVGRLKKNAMVTEIGPTVFSLDQNYPNPFNPTTTISFTVASTANARLDVINSLGQRVATLFDGTASEGNRYSVTFDARELASGIYIYRLTQDGKSFTKMMMLVKYGVGE